MTEISLRSPHPQLVFTTAVVPTVLYTYDISAACFSLVLKWNNNTPTVLYTLHGASRGAINKDKQNTQEREEKKVCSVKKGYRCKAHSLFLFCIKENQKHCIYLSSFLHTGTHDSFNNLHTCVIKKKFTKLFSKAFQTVVKFMLFALEEE